MPDVAVDLTITVTDGEQPTLDATWRASLPVVQPGTGIIPIGGVGQQRPVSTYLAKGLQVSLVQVDGPVGWAPSGTVSLFTLAAGGMVAILGGNQGVTYRLFNTTGSPHTARHFDAGV